MICQIKKIKGIKMKKFILMFLVVTAGLFAQNMEDTSANKIVLKEDVKECVDQVYNNVDAIKLLLTNLSSDENKLNEIMTEIKDDKQMRPVLKRLRDSIKNQWSRNNSNGYNSNSDFDSNKNSEQDSMKIK